MGSNIQGYAKIFDRGWGKECLFIRLNYDFSGSGIILEQSMNAHITLRDGRYALIELVYVGEGEAEIARLFKTSQQNISRWIANNLKVNKKIQKGIK